MIRREPCVCGGVIVADEAVPGPAVLAHNRSPQHEAWRLGFDVVEGDRLLPTTDGKPTWALTMHPLSVLPGRLQEVPPCP